MDEEIITLICRNDLDQWKAEAEKYRDTLTGERFITLLDGVNEMKTDRDRIALEIGSSNTGMIGCTCPPGLSDQDDTCPEPEDHDQYTCKRCWLEWVEEHRHDEETKSRARAALRPGWKFIKDLNPRAVTADGAITLCDKEGWILGDVIPWKGRWMSFVYNEESSEENGWLVKTYDTKEEAMLRVENDHCKRVDWNDDIGGRSTKSPLVMEPLRQWDAGEWHSGVDVCGFR